jgi:anti-anti-sigma factor
VDSVPDQDRVTGPVIVRLPDEIDITNAGQVGEQLSEAFGPGVTMVIADLTDTIFCDSSGVRNLMAAHDKAVQSDAELRLAVPSGSVLRVLQLMGVDRVLPVYPTVSAALTTGPAPAA